jgi:murein DD-endopeptidase MepM/ murein hydrolase activator NlpD
MFSDLEFSSFLDSSGSYEEFISAYYEKHKIGYPDKTPVKGYVTRGIKNNHFGIDIAAKYQDEIYAPGNGKVIFSGMSEDLGNTIIISHPGGFITVYAHNDSNLVISGSTIEKRQVIALIGETGNSQGPHLHFEIWKNNQVLDARAIISEYMKKDVSIR